MKNIHDWSVEGISHALNSGELSSVELTRACLDRIERAEPEINAFITVTAERALMDAKNSDERRAAGKDLGILDGIPYALKDNICTNGILTTCGSRMLESFVPPYSATAEERLRAAGGVLLGKLNMDEFAMGSCTDTSIYGAASNPLDTSRVTGGSSGGSAAAVAAKEAVFTLGSDTGGSVRQPASFCGVVGIKPTYGTVSRYGLVAFAPSLEQIAPITSDVYSNAVVLSAIMGKDTRDATTVERHDDLLAEIDMGARGMRIGVDPSLLDLATEDIRAALTDAADMLRGMGAVIVPITLPDTDACLAAYYVISAAEASSNLARFDGIRYGRRSENVRDIDELFRKSRGEGFGDEVKRRIMLGTYALCHEGRDAYYMKAQAVRRELGTTLNDIFKTCDAVLTPVAPSVAYKKTDKKKLPLELYLEDRLCVMANLAGVPALTVCCGKGEGGMPIGLQLMGAPLSEARLYRIAYSFERARKENA